MFGQAGGALAGSLESEASTCEGTDWGTAIGTRHNPVVAALNYISDV
jgi:hypothetical protein